MIRYFALRFAALTALSFVIFATVGMKSASSEPASASSAQVVTAKAAR